MGDCYAALAMTTCFMLEPSEMAIGNIRQDRHCEERSDVAIFLFFLKQNSFSTRKKGFQAPLLNPLLFDSI